MRALGVATRRRGLGYVLLLTLLILVSSAGGMYAFEREAQAVPGQAQALGINDYGAALWWTAMLVTMGSENWPKTAEGRLLCLLLALYGVAIFGYVTAALATFVISRDAAARETGRT